MRVPFQSPIGLVWREDDRKPVFSALLMFKEIIQRETIGFMLSLGSSPGIRRAKGCLGAPAGGNTITKKSFVVLGNGRGGHVQLI